MVPVKSIDNLTIAPDGCFAFVKQSSSIDISYDSPSGRKEFLEFDAFAHDDGTIIKFFDVQANGQSAWSLLVTTDDGETQVLQWTPYEDNLPAWNNTITRPHEFFGFMNSVDTGEINRNDTVRDVSNRCDANLYGPLRYLPQDGVKPTPMDYSIIKDGTVSIAPILSINGIAHITIQNIHGINMSWRNWPMVTLCGKTLSGMIKQLSEWQKLYVAGIADENFAEDANSILNHLGITEEMILELSETEIMMPTERFMRGYGNPRHGFSETGVMPNSMKNHLMKQLRYRTLSSLEKNHPVHPEINRNLKSEEIEIQKNRVLFFASLFMKNIALEEVTTELIYERFYYHSNETSDSPPSGPESKIFFDGFTAARFFDATE